MCGVIVAPGIVLLLTALGLAIGLTAVGDTCAATASTATGLRLSAGFWAALTLLVAYFLGGLVSTMVTDRPGRGGALVHGALVWILASGCLLLLLGQGISLGASGLLGALSGLTHTATSAVNATGAGGGDLAHQRPQDAAQRVPNPPLGARSRLRQPLKHRLSCLEIRRLMPFGEPSIQRGE